MLDSLLNKILGLYVVIRHGKHEPRIYYHYRHTYRCKLMQLKYIFNDYVLRRKYKVITYGGEFTHELEFALPFAYWHYKNGTLKKTQSSKFTKELYFFSPDHEEIFEDRHPDRNYNFELPRLLYSHDYNIKKWEKVPLKDKYKNDIYIYSKPILIIANRYNKEWGKSPISYYSLEDLKFFITTLRDKYTIIYNRPNPANIVNDNSDIYELGDYKWLKKNHPEVLILDDLYKENLIHANNFNHFQLTVYANCERFISIHGGTAALASYFKGTNIILSKEGLEHYFGCFNTIYEMLSGAKVLHAKTNQEARDMVIEEYT